MRDSIEKIKALMLRYPLLISIAYSCFYFPIFSLLEAYREPEFFVHCGLDDLMPFNEYFVIPYVLWFLFVPGFLLFFIKFSREDYMKCCKVIFGGMTFCLLIYWLFPTALMLREPVENRNVCAWLVNFLRGVDTPTNVCPSIHVSSTVGILLVLFRSEQLKRFRILKAGALCLGILICLSTMILDQHSVIDVICGIALSATLYWMVEQNEAAVGYTLRERILR